MLTGDCIFWFAEANVGIIVGVVVGVIVLLIVIILAVIFGRKHFRRRKLAEKQSGTDRMRTICSILSSML